MAILAGWVRMAEAQDRRPLTRIIIGYRRDRPPAREVDGRVYGMAGAVREKAAPQKRSVGHLWRT
jgi:hypothetical protein